MIEKAFVSGQIAQAIFKEEEKLFLINTNNTKTILDCTPYEKSLFFNSGAEIRTFENITFEELREKLIKEKSFFDALYAAIGGFDPDLSEETRMLSIQRAESLVKNPEIFNCVKSRLLSNIVPEKAILPEALKLAIRNNCENMDFIYQELLNGREVIDYILSAFKEAISELSLEKEFVRIKNIFITTGLFAKLFLHTTNKNLKDLNQLVYEFSNNAKIREEIPLISKILTWMKDKLKGKYKLRIKQSIVLNKLTQTVERLYSNVRDSFQSFELRETKTFFKLLSLSIMLSFLLVLTLPILILLHLTMTKSSHN